MDLSKCPNCGGPADNGHDRELPPNVYDCKECEKQEIAQLPRTNKCGSELRVTLPDSRHVWALTCAHGLKDVPHRCSCAHTITDCESGRKFRLWWSWEPDEAAKILPLTAERG